MKTKINIADYLLTGVRSKRTRRQLVSLMRISDREVRKKISQARQGGVLICSTAHNSGYFIADGSDDPAIGIFIRESMSRIKEEFAVIKPFIDSQKVVSGQVNFDEYKDYLKLSRILGK